MSETTTAALTRTVDGRSVPLPGTYRVDASHTTVDFVARHLMVAKVRGTFTDVSGTLVVPEDPVASSLEASVATTSVSTRDGGRDEHLRSADFFDVEQYPAMTFRSSALEPAGEHWKLTGELTIKDATRTVSFDLEFLGAIADPWGGRRIAFSATTDIDREEFGLTWNAAIETGGVVVGRTVRVELEVELVADAS